jgi:hypothetical protein
MICLVGRRSLPGALAAAVFGLTACAGSIGSPVSLTPNQISPAGFRDSGAQLRATATSKSVLPAACAKKYLGCYTVSRKHGLVIDWCDGPTSDPCVDTKNYTWSGDVCKSNAETCNPIEQMTAKWTGPFKCTTKIKVCGDSTKGTYEADTISIGKNPPKPTKSYAYKQEIILSGSSAGYVGFNVGP